MPQSRDFQEVVSQAFHASIIASDFLLKKVSSFPTFLSRTRSYEEIFSVNLHYVEIQALLKADLSHVTGHTQSESLNSRNAQIYAKNFFIGFGPYWKPTQAD